ncbi:hypothetical protein GF391_04140 [Candidatus Uhrbacteria bacterium]|nr:hypothetical protein [Candidatus Uhrbacteria bacterium]
MFTAYVGLVVIGYQHDFVIQVYFNEEPKGSIIEVRADNLWHAEKGHFPQFRLPPGRTRLVVGSAKTPLGKLTLDGRKFIETEFLCIARSSKAAAQAWVDSTVRRFIIHNRSWNAVKELEDQTYDSEAYWDSARLGKSPEECLADANAKFTQIQSRF